MKTDLFAYYFVGAEMGEYLMFTYSQMCFILKNKEKASIWIILGV